MPDVPTMAELGYPGFEIEGWLGVFVPAATPKEIVTKLSDELARIVASPEGVAGIETLSLVPVGGSAEEFDKAAAPRPRQMGRRREADRRQGRVRRWFLSSFRDASEGRRTRMLQLHTCAIAHLSSCCARPGMTAERLRASYFFKCFAKNARLRGQAMSALALS